MTIPDIEKSNSAWKIYFLSWLDVLEKLDIQILELRHLQSTCIYQIRLPILIELLRFEEALLSPPKKNTCGDDKSKNKIRKKYWNEFSECLKTINSEDPLPEIKALVRDWVPLYPPYLEQAEDEKDESLLNDENKLFSDEYYDKPTPEKIRTLITHIKASVRQCWNTGIWGDGRKDLYNFLSDAQRLKRQILTDRLLFFVEGGRLLGLFQNNVEKTKDINLKGPELWILRMAILTRSQNYLARLEDLQQRLGQNMEVASPEHPRPSIHRRREQGAYNQYLTHRVINIRSDMDNLINFFGNLGAGTTSHSSILHRSAHGFTSKQGVFIDELNELDEGPCISGQNNKHLLEFVQTGYWMLDRQENQPIIAHEVAHHAIRDHYDNIKLQNLANAPHGDVFALLLRQLTYALKCFSVPYNLESSLALSALINPKEIACDLLAASTKANSYLFSFLLEVVGWGLEYTLADSFGYQPHLNIDLNLRRSFVSSKAKNLREWYIRGRILVAWAEIITEHKDPLDVCLINGASEVLKQLNEFLDFTSPNPEDKSGYYWRQLGDRMEAIVTKSQAADYVKYWRQSRSEDNYQPNSKRKHPRHILRIPAEQRNMLVKILLKEKQEIFGYNETLDSDLLSKHYHKDLRHKVYSDTELSGDEYKYRKEQLFKHPYDIPWQCSLLRATDFLNDWHKQTNDTIAPLGIKIYQEVNTNTSLGRRLFLLAIEFHLNLIQPPSEHLWVIKRILKHNLTKHKNIATNRKPSNEDNNDKLIIDSLEQIITNIDRKLKKGSILIKKNDSFEERRKIEAEQEELILTLAISLENNRKEYEKIITTNYDYLLDHLKLSSCGIPNRLSHKTYNKMVHENSQNTSNMFLFANTNIRIDMVSKLCVGGSVQPLGQSENGGSHIDIFETGVTKDEYGASFSTLGSYDQIDFTYDIRPLTRCVFPDVSKTNGNSKKCAPFFQRKETWIAINHSTADDDCPLYLQRDHNLALIKQNDSEKYKDQYLPENPLGVLYVKLNRRYYRINFLKWLTGPGKASLGLTNNDRIFLIDGWADIALIIADRENTKLNPTEEIFKIQDGLYQHFLTSRTELVLSAEAISYIYKNPENFQLDVSVRLREDLYEGNINTEFKEKIKAQILLRLPGCEVSYRSGAMDFIITFSNESIKKVTSYETIEELFKADSDQDSTTHLIDKIATDLRYVSPE